MEDSSNISEVDEIYAELERKYQSIEETHNLIDSLPMKHEYNLYLSMKYIKNFNFERLDTENIEIYLNSLIVLNTCKFENTVNCEITKMLATLESLVFDFSDVNIDHDYGYMIKAVENQFIEKLETEKKKELYFILELFHIIKLNLRLFISDTNNYIKGNQNNIMTWKKYIDRISRNLKQQGNHELIDKAFN